MAATQLLCTVTVWILLLPTVSCHLPSHISTPPNKVDMSCSMAESCFHDTISVCGRMGDEKRSFLDLCDMLEYACDTSQIFTHIDDEDGCPKSKDDDETRRKKLKISY